MFRKKITSTLIGEAKSQSLKGVLAVTLGIVIVVGSMGMAGRINADDS